MFDDQNIHVNRCEVSPYSNHGFPRTHCAARPSRRFCVPPLPPSKYSVFPPFLDCQKLTGHADVPAILQLIRELADYEHELHSVEATEAKLLETIAFAESSSASAPEDDTPPQTEPTSPSKPARCLLLITPEGVPAGMALYFYNYSTWRARPGIYLEDLYVKQSERKRGYGKRLLVALAQEVVTMQGGRLEWSVLKWNEPSIRFYESIGARMMSEWVGMRVDGEGLTKLATLLD